MTKGGRKTARWFWIGVTAAALILRIGLLPISPRTCSVGDHAYYVTWGIQATDRGLLTLYDEPPPAHPMQRIEGGQRLWGGNWVRLVREVDRVCNYPPLSVYLLHGSAIVFQAVSADRLINTTTSHAVFSSWSILGDIVMAAGCAAIVSLFRTRRSVRWSYVLVLFAPPFWWDSILWGQMDTVLLAPLVWMLYAMLRSRWLAAGVLWGLALAIKPQAILCLPLWTYAVLTFRSRTRPLLGCVVAGAVLMLVALPFTLHGGLQWFYASYWNNMMTGWGWTTAHAFNIWYVDYLLTGSDDRMSKMLGITKGTWGSLFLLIGMLTGLVFAVRRWKQDVQGLILWTLLSLLIFMMLPTNVHERYLIMVLPFLGIAAILWPRLWVGLTMLTVVMLAQLSWPVWTKWSLVHPWRIHEWLVLAIALGGAAATVACIATLRIADPTTQATKRDDVG